MDCLWLLHSISERRAWNLAHKNSGVQWCLRSSTITRPESKITLDRLEANKLRRTLLVERLDALLEVLGLAQATIAVTFKLDGNCER